MRPALDAEVHLDEALSNRLRDGLREIYALEPFISVSPLGEVCPDVPHMRENDELSNHLIP